MALNNNRSAFDFTDQYGSDPMMRRYRPVDYMDIREAETAAKTSMSERELAESNLAKAQAELDAKLAPMKMATDNIKSMSDMMKLRSTLQEEANIQRSAAAISDGLSKASDLDSVISLGTNNLLGLKDGVAGPQWRSSVLNGFRQLTENAQSTDDVDRAYAKLPASVAFEPEFKGLYDNARTQASLRQTVREKYAAEPTLGAVPTTATGGVDLPAAGLAIASKVGEEARRNQGIETIKILQKQIGDLRDQITKDAAVGNEKESDKLLLNTYQRQLEKTLQQIGIIPSVVPGSVGTATTVPNAAPVTATEAAPTAPTQTTVGGREDRVGSLLPPGAAAATKPSGSQQAAAASALATGGETPVPENKPATPNPTAEVVSQNRQTMSPENPYFKEVISGEVKKDKEKRKKRSKALTSSNSTWQRQIDKLEYEKDLANQEIEALNNPLFRASPEEKASRYEARVNKIKELDAQIAELKSKQVKRARPAR